MLQVAAAVVEQHLLVVMEQPLAEQVDNLTLQRLHPLQRVQVRPVVVQLVLFLLLLLYKLVLNMVEVVEQVLLLLL